MATDLLIDRLQRQFNDEGSGRSTDRILIPDLTWSAFESLCDEIAERRWRVAYLHGVAEIRIPRLQHEVTRKRLGRMVETLTEELDIPLVSIGSTTLTRRKLERAVEPDEAYYVTSAGRFPNLWNLDSESIPTPDLVIEVVVTSPLLDKLAIYAGLGVPEIWRHTKRGLTVLLLGPDGQYSESATGHALPFLPMDTLAAHLRELDAGNDTRWARRFRLWVREVVAPLYQA